MKILTGGAAVALLMFASSGCAPRALSLESGPRAFTEESYEDVYKAWTRNKESFSWGSLRHVLRATATFESWEFRWAYVVRYAHDYDLPPAARDEMLQASLARARQEHRFFVSLVGDSFRESNLAGKQSAWRVVLIDPEDHQTAPLAIERIRRPVPPEMVYFPSVSPLRESFRITFPAVDTEGRPVIPEGARYVVLRFTGARGQLDLRWNLQGRGSEVVKTFDTAESGSL